MGFSTADALYNAITVSGKILPIPFSRTIYTSVASVAGRWHEALTGGGTGGAMVLTGTAGTGIIMNASSPGALSLGPTPGSGETKHILSAAFNTAGSTVVPGWLLITDILHIYPSLVLVTTPSTMSNHPTWTGTGDTRMTNSNEVQLSMLLTTASTAAGQITPNYIDQDNNTQAIARALFGPIAAHPAGALFGDTGVTATVGGPVAALAVGDYGVKQVNSYAINTGATGGVGCMILHRPLFTIPLAAANTPIERDFSTGPIRFPRVHDNACLGIFVNVGGALATGQVLAGEFVFGWA